MRRLNLLWVLCAVGCGGGYGSGTPTPADVDAMRGILRDYLSAQEIYYSQHDTYSANVTDAGVISSVEI